MDEVRAYIQYHIDCARMIEESDMERDIWYRAIQQGVTFEFVYEEFAGMRGFCVDTCNFVEFGEEEFFAN